jgi:hypothetical protein
VIADAAPATAATQPTEQPKAALPGAKLRWEGPQRVQEGREFDLTLHVTAEQPLRALPLQLSYDAKLLEPLGVRPGSLFADGSFHYHISPHGSILIAASGPAAVPADADLMVISFRAVSAGQSAEVVVSSITIQDAKGASIAADVPVFRTRIIR